MSNQLKNRPIDKLVARLKDFGYDTCVMYPCIGKNTECWLDIKQEYLEKINDNITMDNQDSRLYAMKQLPTAEECVLLEEHILKNFPKDE
jgi:hypothetical protein